MFHKPCLKNQLEHSKGHHIKCAVCETIYGKRIGEMPPGTMTWRTTNHNLPGYEGNQTIEFRYDMPSGAKPDGTKYSGTRRVGYLPASPRGMVIFKMMVEAFKRRLTFLVGTSLTTG